MTLVLQSTSNLSCVRFVEGSVTVLVSGPFALIYNDMQDYELCTIVRASEGDNSHWWTIGFNQKRFSGNRVTG
jgi:hypothetical protein